MSISDDMEVAALSPHQYYAPHQLQHPHQQPAPPQPQQPQQHQQQHQQPLRSSDSDVLLSFMAAAAAAAAAVEPPAKRKLLCGEPSCPSCCNCGALHEAKRAVEQYKSELQVSREAQVYLETTGRRRGFADIYQFAAGPTLQR